MSTTTATALILPFPASARSIEILDAALTLKCLEIPQAETWWKHRVQILANDLLASGIDEASISRQIEDFQAAVFSELGSLTRSPEN